eukprot:g4224.t1
MDPKSATSLKNISEYVHKHLEKKKGLSRFSGEEMKGKLQATHDGNQQVRNNAWDHPRRVVSKSLTSTHRRVKGPKKTTPPSSWRSTLEFTLNGRQQKINFSDPLSKFTPTTLLSEYLHSCGLSGTKVACGEGGCGACTVVLSKVRADRDQISHAAINACLRPICSIDGMVVSTIEGLSAFNDDCTEEKTSSSSSSCCKSKHKKTKCCTSTTGGEEIAAHLAAGNGSQCGFCSPGWVMSMQGLLLQHAETSKTLSAADIERYFDGNLCRCTGYRPILKTMKAFASTNTKGDHHEDLQDLETCHIPRRACGEMFDAKRQKMIIDASYDDLCFVSPNKQLTYYRPTSMSSLVEAYKNFQGDTVQFLCGNTSIGVDKYYMECGPRAGQVADVGTIRGQGVNTTRKSFAWIDTIRIGVLQEMYASEAHGLTVGSSVCMSDLINFLKTSASSFEGLYGKVSNNGGTEEKVKDGVVQLEDETPLHPYLALARHISYIATSQVRNVASWAGSIMLARDYRDFPADFATLLTATNAYLVVQDFPFPQSSQLPSMRVVSAADFLAEKTPGSSSVGTDKTFIVSLHIPITPSGKLTPSFFNLDSSSSSKHASNVGSGELSATAHSSSAAGLSACLSTFKVMPRRKNAHAVVNMGALLAIDPSSLHVDPNSLHEEESKGAIRHHRSAEVRALPSGKISTSRIVFSSRETFNAFRCPLTEGVLNGALLNQDTLTKALQALASDWKTAPDSAQPKLQLAQSLLYKAFLSTLALICGGGSSGVSAALPASLQTAVDFLPSRNVSSGSECYDKAIAKNAVPKLSALKQTTGKAVYVGEKEKVRQGDVVFATYVRATRDAVCHSLAALNKAPAVALAGVLAVLSSDDIPTGGANQIGVSGDEKLLLSVGDRVEYAGQPVAIVVAQSSQIALNVAIWMEDPSNKCVVYSTSTKYAKNRHPKYEWPLPEGWQEYANPKDTSKRFYVNHSRRETSLERPCRLPKGWEERVDTSSKRKFYMDHNNRETQWQHPGIIEHQRKWNSEKASTPSAPTPIFNIEDGIAQSSFYPNLPPTAGGYMAQVTNSTKEKVESALGSAAHRLQGRVSTGGQMHFYLETNRAVATVDGESGAVTISASTQSTAFIQNFVSANLAMPMNLVNVKTRRSGGAFGGKITRCLPVSVGAALAAKVITQLGIDAAAGRASGDSGNGLSMDINYAHGCTVIFENDRNTDMESSGAREPVIADWDVGFDDKGKISAFYCKFYMDCGATMDTSFGDLSQAQMWADSCYYVPQYCTEAVAVKTNLPTNTSMRAPGGAQSVLALESAAEAIAEFLQQTPESIKSANFYQNGQVTPLGMNITGNTLNSGSNPIWSSAVSSFALAKRRAEIDQYNAANRWTKRGIGIVPIKYGIGWTGTQNGAVVRIYPNDGTVQVNHGGCEVGQGINTKVAQSVAITLGIDLSLIKVEATTTVQVPNNTPTGGSSTSELACQAAVAACNKLLPGITAARKAVGPNKTWADVVAQLVGSGSEVCATGYFAPQDNGKYEPASSPFRYNVYGAAVSEIEVDILTGCVNIVQSDLLYDCGTSLNPDVDLGQVEGAYVQALGYFFNESLEFDAKDGTLLTDGTWNYKIPSAFDIPSVFNVTLAPNMNNTSGFIGSKATGEPATLLAASAYYAVLHAIQSFQSRGKKAAGKTSQSYKAIKVPLLPLDVISACNIDPVTDFTISS